MIYRLFEFEKLTFHLEISFSCQSIDEHVIHFKYLF